jgi:hypothetical protein
MPRTLPRFLLPLSFGLLFALDASAQGSDDFDRESAKSVLDSVDVSQCKVKKGPVGEGHVVVTYLPTGKAKVAVVDRGPFVGTKSEKCIVKVYKKTSVPPFKGEPVTVGKTFKID